MASASASVFAMGGLERASGFAAGSGEAYGAGESAGAGVASGAGAFDPSEEAGLASEGSCTGAEGCDSLEAQPMSARGQKRRIRSKAGDFMWLRAFCPQACYAGGPGLFRYLLYKDVNRHPKW